MASPAQSKPPVRVSELPSEEIYFGPSEAMNAIRQKVHRAAGLNVPILILGESGVGKEVLARFVHSRSPWQAGPFVKVNCPAIPGTLLESELFGFEKGAFTGAIATKPGRIELAANGTLFLDEVADLEANLQAKLLHVLQDGTFTHLGGHEELRLQARVICATNHPLQSEIGLGSFRSDLFYRINVITITVPPLRERRADVPVLVQYLREKFNARYQRSSPPVSRETLQYLEQRDWPGNVRELENCVARYVILGTEEVFYVDRPERKPVHYSYGEAEGGKIPLKRISQEVTRRIEKELILKVLQANHWNRRKTAEALKISYRALLYKVKQAGLPAKRLRQKLEPKAAAAALPGSHPAD